MRKQTNMEFRKFWFPKKLMLPYKKNNQQQQQNQKSVKMFWNKGDNNGITLKGNT